MPHLETIRAAIAALPLSCDPYVVVLPGGTTSIGSYIADALAESFARHGARLRVYIVGRNNARADALMTKSRAISPGSDWRFVRVDDLAYLREVDRACEQIIQQESSNPLHATPSIDLCYLTFCWPILKTRRETSEGLDSFLATTYYSRVRFITQLMPLLIAPSRPGHVISVYAGGFEDGTRAGDEPIGLPPPHEYGVTGVRKYTCFMKNFLFEELAARHEGKLVLIHVFPGLVDGPGFLTPDMPGWFRCMWALAKPLIWLVMKKPEDCGRTMLYLATEHFSPKGVTLDGSGQTTAKGSSGEVGGGSYAMSSNGDVANKTIMFREARTAGLSQKVWDHTMSTISHAIEIGARHDA